MTLAKSILLLSGLSILAFFSCKKGDSDPVKKTVYNGNKTTTYIGNYTEHDSWRLPQPNGSVDSGTRDSSYLKTIVVTVVNDTVNIETHKFKETSSGYYLWQTSVHDRTHFYVYPDSLRIVHEASISNGLGGAAYGFTSSLDVFKGNAQ